MTSDLCLVDSNVWIDHLARPEPALILLMEQGRALVAEDCIVEVMLGAIGDRARSNAVYRDLTRGPYVVRHIGHERICGLLDNLRLGGNGLQAVDTQIFALAYKHGWSIWTRDKRLRAACLRHGVRLLNPTDVAMQPNE